jgi:HPt (histidine-containing phosphotransfer) domain-containing protein
MHVADTLPLIDLDVFADARALLEDAFAEMVAYYRDDSPRLLGQMRQLHAAGERAEWGRLAHTLKSSSRQLGLRRVGECAARLEQLAAEPALEEEEQAFAALAEALSLTLAQLSNA